MNTQTTETKSLNEVLPDWRRRADEWFATDYAFITDHAGWRTRTKRATLAIWDRPTPDDPNHLFRWHLPRVAASASVVFDGFVHKILDYHQHWTREYRGGHIIETLGPDARVMYQHFDPGIPGIAKRDFCAIEVVRELSPGVFQACYRSVNVMPKPPGYERINWWGGVLCRARDDQSSELFFLDRENQGGNFPAWLMNLVMPRYLVYQCEHLLKFFAEGGPRELHTPNKQSATTVEPLAVGGP